ncbi:MAG: AmmeMemoRadiSam system protein B [Verrucomicrobiae bacterium]
MSAGRRFLFVAAVLAAGWPAAVLTGCKDRTPRAQPQEQPEAESPPPRRVREPAVAGLFYPKDPADLSGALDGLLAGAKPQTIEGDLRALICPHAGYPFSGPVAASAYRLLAGREYQTVVLLGVSHYAAFAGASVADAEIYRTPLGDVPVSPKAGQLAKEKPFVLEPRCRVQRPPWSAQASHALPPEGGDTPETWEHSAEVQVPFLQKTLANFQLVPVVIGEADPEEMARVLAGLLDDSTLVVASSDLSHYHPYDQARELDARCVRAICDLDVGEMKSQEACGRAPVLTLLYLARQMGWKAKLLDCRNSGDIAGNKDGVVGYASVAFYSPHPQGFTDGERGQLLALARQSLKNAVSQDGGPGISPNSFPAKFAEKKGCFVTLTERGQLRGCIGHILPQEPLSRAIADNAAKAALHDPRFDPVQPGELDKIGIEISVLTEPAALAFQSPDDLLGKLRPHRDGVVLKIGDRIATYLPQVWSQIPNRADFLDSLSQKAGCARADWRNPGAEVYVYQVESFSEPDR